MLRELLIENLAIIEKLNLEFGDGLITLTGETGALFYPKRKIKMGR